RSGGVVLQILALALALASLTVQPVPWAFIVGVGAPGLVGLVLLISTSRREGSPEAEPQPEAEPGPATATPPESEPRAAVEPQRLAQPRDVAGGLDVVLGDGDDTVFIQHERRADHTLDDLAVVHLLAPHAVGGVHGMVGIAEQREGEPVAVTELGELR